MSDGESPEPLHEDKEPLEESLERPLILNPSTNSTVLEAPSPQFKTRRRMTKLQVASGICLLVGLVVALAVPPLLHNVIVEKAIDQVTLQPNNEGTWAHFPGDTDTVITRNFTFHKIENPKEFLFLGEKPRFR